MWPQRKAALNFQEGAEQGLLRDMISKLERGLPAIGVSGTLFVLAITTLLLSGADKSCARQLPPEVKYEGNGMHQGQEILGIKHQVLRSLTQAPIFRTDICDSCPQIDVCMTLPSCSNNTDASAPGPSNG